jgi:ribosome-binding factor A
MTQRTARIDELLREEISSILRREVDDPRIGFVTITDVEVDRELSHASVWVSVIGSEKERRTTIRALVRAMPFVRRQLGRLRLKRIPALHIKEDQSAERGTRILRILGDLESGAEEVIQPQRIEETLPTPTGVSARDEAPPRPRASSRGTRRTPARGKESPSKARGKGSPSKARGKGSLSKASPRRRES